MSDYSKMTNTELAEAKPKPIATQSVGQYVSRLEDWALETQLRFQNDKSISPVAADIPWGFVENQLLRMGQKSRLDALVSAFQANDSVPVSDACRGVASGLLGEAGYMVWKSEHGWCWRELARPTRTLCDLSEPAAYLAALEHLAANGGAA